MNPLRKAYCRIFQTAFRIALPLLPYREPTVLGSVEEAVELLAREGKRRPLIVTDKGIHGLGSSTRSRSASRRPAWRTRSMTRPCPTPRSTTWRRHAPSTWPTAATRSSPSGAAPPWTAPRRPGHAWPSPGSPSPRCAASSASAGRLPLLIAVPTTAGTGSETTLAAVITDGKTHYKYPINDFCLIPRYAVLDYRTTLGLPRQVTSTTGIDALVHAVEAYIGRSTTKETRANAEEAVRLVKAYLKRAYDDGSDAEARSGMLRAAFCAGAAFTKSYVGYVHGVAHSLGGQYGVPHGLANAVICPYVLDLYGESCHRRLGQARPHLRDRPRRRRRRRGVACLRRMV